VTAAGTVTGAVGTIKYSWKNASSIEEQPFQLRTCTAGTYTLTVSDDCSSKSNSVTVGQPAAAFSFSYSTKTDALF
jgi:hypothetical protein